ncbi:hypothetical protein CLAFUW4_10123 [Fulvia fulva]|nr:hypothetical protein CLAFUR4_10127 [Fulvia fulva]KAK4617212.1 hypothetical protein CLAFUR0_10125 [Fulvia fulva]WPV19083.1 hypothetical protein CLAFUW4_10123 [Fulvia fulva]WPV34306.1 hypothetical protein CLAFUW7_10124 [Fulvia fulva]
MRTTLFTALFLTILGSAFASENCKCQDPSGTGPQRNDLTGQCCPGSAVSSCEKHDFPGPNHQCTGGSTTCLNDDAFDKCCKDAGAPGAYCW